MWVGSIEEACRSESRDRAYSPGPYFARREKLPLPDQILKVLRRSYFSGRPALRSPSYKYFSTRRRYSGFSDRRIARIFAIVKPGAVRSTSALAAAAFSMSPWFAYAAAKVR